VNRRDSNQHSGSLHADGVSSTWRRSLLGAGLLLAAVYGAVGCGETTRRYAPEMYYYFNRKDPLVVLRDPKASGDDRYHALLLLKEPLAHGGKQDEQELVLQILKYTALSDSQAICRTAAYSVLRNFKDPRAADILREAYYKTTAFAPSAGTMLRCQVLEALGATQNPGAVDLLVRVLREPPATGSDVDTQAQLDERSAAARALAHYTDYKATRALVDALQKETDVGLRTEVHQALVQSTGRDLPADPVAWNNLMNQTPGQPLAPQSPSFGDRFMTLVGLKQSAQASQAPATIETPSPTPAPATIAAPTPVTGSH
jgi:hypothetical protein